MSTMLLPSLYTSKVEENKPRTLPFIIYSATTLNTRRALVCASLSPPATVPTSTACVPGNYFVAHTTSRLVSTIPGTVVFNTHAWLMTRTCCVDRRVKCTAVFYRAKCAALSPATLQHFTVRMLYEVLRIKSRYKFSDYTACIIYTWWFACCVRRCQHRIISSYGMYAI